MLGLPISPAQVSGVGSGVASTLCRAPKSPVAAAATPPAAKTATSESGTMRRESLGAARSSRLAGAKDSSGARNSFTTASSGSLLLVISSLHYWSSQASRLFRRVFTEALRKPFARARQVLTHSVGRAVENLGQLLGVEPVHVAQDQQGTLLVA